MLSISRGRTIAALAVVAVGFASAARAQSVPERLSDAEFWGLMTSYSEPWGTFRSENFVSNETSLQYVIPELQRTVKPGSAYLGVAPDQNFTYITSLKPSIAFIVDIRHQNAVQHLMYKALIETSANRAEFLSKLFSTPPLPGVNDSSSALALFEALTKVEQDSSLYRKNMQAIRNQLMKVHNFALSDSELVSLECVYGAFYNVGPRLNYNYSSSCRNPGPYGSMRGGMMIPVGPVGAAGGPPPMGGGFTMRSGGGMPNYLEMLNESDGLGSNRSYLGSEANFRLLKNYEERNLIVPVTGNFAGDKALKLVGQYLRDHGTTVGGFYVSNVEQYLFQQGDEATRFYQNVATLPLDKNSTFIRSYSMGGMYGGGSVQLKQQSGRSMQLIGSVMDVVNAFQAGSLPFYASVIQLSHQ